MPDHGEVINKGHGFSEMTASQFEIPLIAWSENPDYISRFRKIIQRYSIRNGRVFNTSALPFVMAELMGYHVDERTRVQSLEDSNYVLNVDGYAYPLSELKSD